MDHLPPAVDFDQAYGHGAHINPQTMFIFQHQVSPFGYFRSGLQNYSFSFTSSQNSESPFFHPAR